MCGRGAQFWRPRFDLAKISPVDLGCLQRPIQGLCRGYHCCNSQGFRFPTATLPTARTSPQLHPPGLAPPHTSSPDSMVLTTGTFPWPAPFHGCDPDSLHIPTAVFLRACTPRHIYPSDALRHEILAHLISGTFCLCRMQTL